MTFISHIDQKLYDILIEKGKRVEKVLKRRQFKAKQELRLAEVKEKLIVNEILEEDLSIVVESEEVNDKEVVIEGELHVVSWTHWNG